jgi:acetylornithine deacetylase/succinyl-diaminopimelate desuccinylase-like protein
MSYLATPADIVGFWDDAILPTLLDYIRIPAKSPHFDPQWEAHGYIEDAVRLAERWCRSQALPGMALEVVRLEGRTPVLLIEVPAANGGSTSNTVLIYGHLDKQPEMTGWRDDLGPWKPVIEGPRLYGRGGADDGYAVFCAMSSLRHLATHKLPYPRCLILIECCEESGSYDLPAYLEALAPRIGTPTLVVGLDSGCGNYSQLWGTSSLRGIVNGLLTVEILNEGVHSGDASGVVPSSFRIARILLDRIDAATSGIVRDGAFHADIPPQRIEQARRASEVLGEKIWSKFPLVDGARPMGSDLVELVLNRTWKPMLAVTGAEGLPNPADSGNVLRPRTALVLSLRLPPIVNADKAAHRLKEILEKDPPYGATVTFECKQASTGWHAPITPPWLQQALEAASQRYYGEPMMWMGEGGTIPFMAMLGARYPTAQFLITGVLGPQSNAHGPNEYLHLDYAKRLTVCVSGVISAASTI